MASGLNESNQSEQDEGTISTALESDGSRLSPLTVNDILQVISLLSLVPILNMGIMTLPYGFW